MTPAADEALLEPTAGDAEPEDPFTEDELAALAMADDPDQVVPSDAIPMSLYLATQVVTLPQWYMPPAVARVGTKWRTAVVLAIVLALVMIDAWGLCSTYGTVTLA